MQKGKLFARGRAQHTSPLLSIGLQGRQCQRMEEAFFGRRHFLGWGPQGLAPLTWLRPHPVLCVHHKGEKSFKTSRGAFLEARQVYTAVEPGESWGFGGIKANAGAVSTQGNCTPCHGDPYFSATCGYVVWANYTHPRKILVL